MLNIYKASAGSGKTYALTREFLKIIFNNPDEYRNILAVTFTNKATGEMKSRIITELHKLAESDSSPYLEDIKVETGLNEFQIRNRANDLQSKILHDFGMLSVFTIDRFFQRILRSFAKELNVFAGYSIELNLDLVLDSAIDNLLSSVGKNKALHNWLSTLVHSQIKENKNWNIPSILRGFREQLFNEDYLILDNDVKQCFDNKEFMSNYISILNFQIEQIEEGMSNIANEALSLIKSNNLVKDDFTRGVITCFENTLESHNPKFNQTFNKATNDPTKWCAKTSPNYALVQSIAPRLSEIASSLYAYYEKNVKDYNTSKFIRAHLYQLGLIMDIGNCVRHYCDDNNCMLMSDTTQLLRSLISENDTPFIYEKSGNYYKHIMIDEFQDTSRMQWDNFKPLISNSLSEADNRVLIVGDVKQSIYRWRGGDWTLLSKKVYNDFQQMGVNVTTLDTNWRSSKSIVDFNNHLFPFLSESLKTALDTSLKDTKFSDAIIEAYSDVKQNVHNDKYCGYVEMAFSDGVEDDIIDNTIGIINKCLARGIKPGDIAILVRTNTEGAKIASSIIEYNDCHDEKIPFVSSEALKVNSALSIKLILSILKFMIDPDDQPNKFSIVWHYNMLFNTGALIDGHSLFTTSEGSDVLALLESCSGIDVRAFSLFETIEIIIDKFNIKTCSKELAYILSFQDVIFDYETSNSNDIQTFLNWWDLRSEKAAIAANNSIDAVQIMTIHKSKGLEFDTVIIPFCDWKICDNNDIMWCHNTVDPYKQIPIVPVKKVQDLTQSYFHDDYAKELMMEIMDSLNTLYVAFTRAKNELYIISETPNAKSSSTYGSVGRYLYDYAKNQDYSFGKIESRNNASLYEVNAINMVDYPVFELKNRVSVNYNYSKYISESNNETMSAIDSGKLLHEILSCIESIDDIDMAISQSVVNGLIQNEDVDYYKKTIKDYLSKPEVAQWYSKDNVIMNERNIIFPNGNILRPDRVVETPDCIYVIDYKFGKQKESKYKTQVNTYCKTFLQMGYKKVKGYIWYVTLDSIENVF